MSFLNEATPKENGGEVDHRFKLGECDEGPEDGPVHTGQNRWMDSQSLNPSLSLESGHWTGKGQEFCAATSYLFLKVPWSLGSFGTCASHHYTMSDTRPATAAKPTGVVLRYVSSVRICFPWKRRVDFNDILHSAAFGSLLSYLHRFSHTENTLNQLTKAEILVFHFFSYSIFELSKSSTQKFMKTNDFKRKKNHQKIHAFQCIF